MIKHLKENKIGYFAHMRRAFHISQTMIFAGIACFIHGIFPHIFTDTASNKIEYLHNNVINRRLHGEKEKRR